MLRRRSCFLLFLLSLGNAAGAQPPRSADGTEPVRWLREYLQIDTTNPPGNEREAAEYLAGILETEGIPYRLLTSPDGRTSLYARLASPASGGAAVALVHHLDVVPAEGGWSQEPFSGRPLDGSLWGRGAIDVKSLGIAQLAALIACHRSGAALSHDVIYLAAADEERGGGEGTGWLVAEHGDLFSGLVGVLGEGGSNRAVAGRVLWWGIEVTQKRPLWLRVTAHGRGGHGSGFKPASATHQLVRALARLVDRPLRFRVCEATRSYMTALATVEGGRTAELAGRLDEVVRGEDPASEMGPGLPAYFVDTVQVTAIDNGRGPNVVAAEASAYVDIRLLPDTDADRFLEEVREALGPGIEVEVLLSSPEAPPSPVGDPLYRALEDVLSVRAPVLPILISGTTDSRYFRERGVPAYGFSPFGLEPPELLGIHARDERIPEDVFLRGVETMRRILLAYAGGDG